MDSPNEVNDKMSDTKTSGEHPSTFISPCDRPAYDKSVTIEEYMHYAKLTRQEEKDLPPNPEKSGSFIDQVFRRKSVESAITANGTNSPTTADEKTGTQAQPLDGRATISPDEWRDASRLMRTASCE